MSHECTVQGPVVSKARLRELVAVRSNPVGGRSRIRMATQESHGSMEEYSIFVV